MSSVAGAADVPEEFAALADYAVDDFMSEAASDVEVFATTEGHGDVSAEEIRFLTRDPHAHDRVISRVARLPDVVDPPSTRYGGEGGEGGEGVLGCFARASWAAS